MKSGRKRVPASCLRPGGQNQSVQRAREGSTDEAADAALDGPLEQSTDTQDAPDLPGFYYDPERNRYFRLLPGHNNFNPLTNSSLRRQQQEKDRLKMVEEDNRCSPKVPDSRCTVSRLVERRRVGLQGPQSYCRLMHELKISGMRKQSVEITGAESDAVAFKLIKADSRCERLFALYDLGPGFCKYGLMTLDWQNGSAQAQLWYNHYFTNRMVKSVCWASLTGQDSHLLLSLMGYVDTSGCVSLLPASLFLPDDHEKRPGQVYNFKQMAFTCAWSRCPQIDCSFSAGCPRKAVVMDVVTTQQQHFHTLSDVLAQCFATQAPLLYSGSRSGEVWSWDLRQRAPRLGPKPSLFRLSSAATSLSLLSDENYLVAADMAGKINLWDMRAQRTVQNFEGHQNKHYILPVHVEEALGTVVAVGQDYVTRIWSLRNGRLLRSVPSPVPVSCEGVPSVVLSPHLGGTRGEPGLLMAAGKQLLRYSYSERA
uniref:DDB1- and CUL4-associated factor 4 n=1 Tax=Myxine glutinosa TaxID=7769 RepID=UPI0035901D9C